MTDESGTRRREWMVHGALVATQIGFGTLPLSGQMAMQSIEPHGLAMLRMAGAALVLGLVAGRRLASVGKADLARLALFSFLGVLGNQVLFLNGLSRSTQINAAVLITSIPVFTVAFALLLGREKASWQGIAGIALGLAGALVLARIERFDPSDRVAVGNVMILVNAAFWSLYLVLARPVLERLGPLVVISWMFIIASVAWAPFGVPAVVRAAREAPASAWVAAAWVVAVPTVMSYLLTVWALRETAASRVAIYVYMQPLVAGLLAWLVADESVGPRTGVAAVLIFAGVALVQVAGMRKSKGRCVPRIEAYSAPNGRSSRDSRCRRG